VTAVLHTLPTFVERRLYAARVTGTTAGDAFRETPGQVVHGQVPVFSGFLETGLAYGLLGLHQASRTKALARRVSEWHSGTKHSMRIRLLLVASFLLAVGVATATADSRTDAKRQVEFGIAVAQRGLWREAIYRWERATQIDPTYAAAHNNLAVAYEHEGDLDKARAAYEKAIELEPDNGLIKQNYELFREINDRTTRKEPQ
jgi:tetratricopeptide (TPR) repeat protein